MKTPAIYDSILADSHYNGKGITISLPRPIIDRTPLQIALEKMETSNPSFSERKLWFMRFDKDVIRTGTDFKTNLPKYSTRSKPVEYSVLDFRF